MAITNHKSVKRAGYLAAVSLVGIALFVQCVVLTKDMLIRKHESVWTDVELMVRDAHAGRTPVITPGEIADVLVECIIQIESGGDPMKVGSVGERGLMQVKSDTWRDITTRTYGDPLPFALAFEADVNERVGRLYLDYLQEFLHAHRDAWKGDERALLLASYNAGPGRVQRAGFDINRLPAVVQDYVKRGVALHEYLLAEQANSVRHMLVSYSTATFTDG